MARIIAIEAAQARRWQQGRGRLWQRFWMFAAVALLAVAGGAMLLTFRTTVIPATESARFIACGDGPRQDCIVDGDTFHYGGDIIRIADIDTPEVHDYRCAAEKALGDRATVRLRALLNAGPFALQSADRDADRYGRKLRIVTRNGLSLGDVLVAEGLARRWDGSRHPWC